MHKLGFHSTWINRVWACVTIVSYSLLINDQSTRFIKPTRGLQQGDHLSPYLFILCMEILAGCINVACYDRKIGIGVKPCSQGPFIPALFFVDDSLLFCRATQSASIILK